MDLGILLFVDLSVSNQCFSAAGRANRTLGAIRMTFKNSDNRALVVLNKAFVCPLLEYCSPVWNSYNKKDIKTLEYIKRRMTRLHPELRSLPYEDRLSSLHLTSCRLGVYALT